VKTRSVPASEITTRSLRARDYVYTEVERERQKVELRLAKLYKARAAYLKAAGWKPFAEYGGGGDAFVYWTDPKLGHHLREDRAAELQEQRDNNVVHRDHSEES
jgi:hypothetical protein